MLQVEIDPRAGFCFGVTRVVKQAEDIIREQGELYCLGEIVHNQKEIERLEALGLKTITHEMYHTLSDCRVLIRAHGEPPETYTYARDNRIELVDGTCPIVLKLQSRIKKDFRDQPDGGAQIVIFGKKDHAEVRGLAGQTEYRTIIIESEQDLGKIDFGRPVHLYAQTTMDTDKYGHLQHLIREKSQQAGHEAASVKCNNSICGQVSGRVPQLRLFCAGKDVVIFVSYTQSSNGKLLFAQCKSVNEHSHFVSATDDLKAEWFDGVKTVGITGATSTPRWLLEKFSGFLQRF